MIINRGVSFGFYFPAINLVIVAVLFILVSFWWKEKKAWGFLLMILGGFLNLLERFKFGGVRDYWKIPLISVYNNLNDYLIAVGVIQIFLYFLWKKRQK